MSYILLLEPNTLLAQTYTNLLGHAGFAVRHATTAQQAVNIADKETPQLVILELQLPLHSGIEFLHEFRSYSEWLSVPAVVHTLTAPARLGPVGDVLRQDLGVQRVLYKPGTTLQELLSVVRELAPV